MTLMIEDELISTKAALIDAALIHATLIQEREQLRAEVERLKDTGAVLVRSLERMTAERDALRRVYTAANDWLTNLGAKGHRYHDGVPGELMDAVDAVDALEEVKPWKP